MNREFNDAFKHAYATLNNEQKQAVDTIDGPVLVIAGPGTGKTQLLSVRVANILRRTDTLPENILCLTFSEIGARNMRMRLSDIIGPDAYKVGVSTFHSFGTDVINRYPEYFYNGAAMKPADALMQHRLIEQVLADLPPSNYFTMRYDDEYTMITGALNMVSDIKRAGLSPEEVRAVCAQNMAFIDFAEPLFDQAFAGTVGKHTLPACELLASNLQTNEAGDGVHKNFYSLNELCLRQLRSAIDSAKVHPKVTPPLTSFKSTWRDSKYINSFTLKAREQTKRLKDAAEVYDMYQHLLATERLFDYDDMIVQVVHELEQNGELRASLQEQYQYLLVDEFQDTNLAQLRIVQALCDNPVNEGKPNIMVVGDDDQTIYAFQGAEIGNMIDFSNLYPGYKPIVLTTSYRSAQEILDLSRAVILQGENRLEVRDKTLIKQLVADSENPHPGVIERHDFQSKIDEQTWVVDKVKALLKQGVKPQEISIISAKHNRLQAIAPFFQHEQIPITYEKKENVLEFPHIVVLLQLSRVIEYMRRRDLKHAETLLPELLTHPMWQLTPKSIWNLSMASYKADDTKKFWLEQMQQSEDQALRQIADWLIDTSERANHETLEPMLDRLIGIHDAKEGEFVSPYHNFYFATESLQDNSLSFVEFLGALSTLREALRNYEPKQRLMLQHLLEFVDRASATGTHITLEKNVGQASQAVSLLSAHGAKGLEFDCVFILDSNENTWVKSGGYQLSYPLNVAQLKRGGHELDDRLRLFYVALTRAKKMLLISRAVREANGKEQLPVGFLAEPSILKTAPLIEHTDQLEVSKQLVSSEINWHGIHLNAAVGGHEALAPILDDFQLSVTALDNFLDLEHGGGPQTFLERNLLKFPSALTPSEAFGSAVHRTLQAAHNAVRKGEPKSNDELLDIFRVELKNLRINIRDEKQWLEKGNEYLTGYFETKLRNFTADQLAERDFKNQACVVGAARLTGKLDLMEIKINKIVVTDYKTGTPESRWSLNDTAANAKLYRYRRQLTFYKLLIESSAEYGRRFTVEQGILSFIQPTKDTGQLLDLTCHIEADDAERLRLLIQAVWLKIMALDFPDTSGYSPNLTGIKQFEQDLLKGKI
jgi:DNA helicase-2/ATP-dependent DNA helicase PcrA